MNEKLYDDLQYLLAMYDSALKHAMMRIPNTEMGKREYDFRKGITKKIKEVSDELVNFYKKGE